MNKLTFWIVGIGVLTTLSLFIFKPQKTQKASNVNATPTSTSSSNIKNDTSNNGEYVEFENGILENYTNIKRVLFFYANWCPTCKPADAEFSKNLSKIPEGIVVIRVNYNDNQTDTDEESLAKMFSITYQHTFVQIDENSQEIAKWNGGGITELLSNIK